MSSGHHNDFTQVWDRLHQNLRGQQWRGYDPYDGLNSPLAKLFPFKPARQAWIQLHKRSPINLRPLVGIAKHTSPKTLALAISALCLRYKTLGHDELLGEAQSLAGQLLALRSSGTKRLAWGYPFDWQSRAFFAPADTPNMICTVFGANALLDLYAASNLAEYRDQAVQCCQFIRNDLPHTMRGNAFCFSYTPLDRSCVHNVNLLGAALLARAAAATGNGEWFDEAKRAMTFSVEAQEPSGRWPYGEAANQGWADGFHTGYNLIALRDYEERSGDTSFRHARERGWKYYRDHFFLEDGTPKYYDAVVNPIDIHSAAQGIITFLDVGADREGAEKIAHWTIEHLWDARGWFAFQRTRAWTNRVPYTRWAGAWMLLSLARLMQLAR